MIPLFHWNTPELQSYLKKIDSRGSEPDPQIEKQVASIIAAVRTQGDIAVREFTRQFDGINLPSLRIDPAEVGELAAQVDPELRHVLRLAKE
ncbi:MAG: histidinol dehydrogenase, partial [Acidobacteria bacterium]|nr:histidinol dehydrogenase [Acidobacteriota bacterium]